MKQENLPYDQSQGVVWVWASAITKLLNDYGKVVDIPTWSKRNRPPPIQAADLWDQLSREWFKLEKTSHGFESSSSKDAAAKVSVPDLAGGPTMNIRCPHGQLMPGPKAMLVLEADINDLLRLEKDREELWKEFGARGISARISRGNLPPADAQECCACKEAKREAAATKRSDKDNKKKMKQRFKVLVTGRLPMDKNGMFPQLATGSYCLIPADWRQKWLEHVNGTDAPVPPHLDPSVLRCKHDGLRYNPIEYFEESRDALAGNIKDHHPQEGAYVLVPRGEAEEIYKSFRPGSSEPAWCSLECQRISGAAAYEKTTRFECKPVPCKLCTGVDASYTLDVKIETELLLRTVDGYTIAARQLDVPGKTMGVEVKDKIISEFGFENVVAGQLLLSINGTSFGDCDLLEQILGTQAFIRKASLTVEIYDFVMSEPSPKRHRSSLLNSNLAGQQGQ